MTLQVCVRKGTQIVLHPDQVKQWTNSGMEYEEAFKSMKDEHESKYLNMLTSIIQRTTASAGSTAQTSVVASGTAASETVEQDVEPPPLPPATRQKVTFESIDKLQAQDPIQVRCASEISGVELLLCQSGNVYLCGDKDKVLPKFTVLGGFGTGKFLDSACKVLVNCFVELSPFFF